MEFYRLLFFLGLYWFDQTLGTYMARLFRGATEHSCILCSGGWKC